MAWSEEEARASVNAYFKLMAAEQRGNPIAKAPLYRKLSDQFRNRSAKAFEAIQRLYLSTKALAGLLHGAPSPR